uniref:rRNA N-glycosylase n=2 Tax=Aegilops tauschii subsp. strangulata TaxID=200361 RepID=A0A453MVR9_AEGTS
MEQTQSNCTPCLCTKHNSFNFTPLAFLQREGVSMGQDIRMIFIAVLFSFVIYTRSEGEGIIWNALAPSYQSFYHEVHVVGQFGPLHETHTVLAPLDKDVDQKLTPPTQWINVTVLGEGQDRVKIMWRNENLYFLSFVTPADRLCYMKGYGALFHGRGTELTFGESYPDLIKGGYESLTQVQLGREALLRAIHIMANYDPRITPEEDIKVAVLTMTIMGPESLRFNGVRAIFTADLDKVTFLSKDQTKYIPKWGLLSVALFCEKYDCYNSYLKSQMKKLKLYGETEELHGILDMMLRPQRMNDSGDLKPKETKPRKPKE